jgi:Dolichyl-phosphate-mannose-protein mannosyltransferase
MRPGVQIWLLVGLIVLFGVLGNSAIAGGSDSYGYISQADLWLTGSLHIPQPAAESAPWPLRDWTFAPIGYRPSVDGDSIVPTYPPGLPLILAAFKAAGGHCAMRWVIPFSGGLLVWVTFAIGRRMFSDQIGIAGAWLVATSPVLLVMLRHVMSDVPVAAFWGLAVYGCLLASLTGAFLGGAAAAVAILIRPNLAHLALIAALWLAVRDASRQPFRIDLRRALLFSLPVLAGAAIVALVNRDLYGGVTNTGYGELGGLFSQYRALPNITRYTTWLVTSQTPLALVGLIALFLPVGRWMRNAPRVPGKGLLAAVCAGVVGSYLVWIIFDAWWYLRFLLPCWPAIGVTSAWVLSWPSGRELGRVGKLVLVSVGLYGLVFAQKTGAFEFSGGDQRYVTIAHLVRDATPPGSVIFTMQHSGSVRYYGERMTLRYDYLHARWLDRTVEWLNRQGMHPYFLLEQSEVEQFQRRFIRDNALAKLQMARVFEYGGDQRVYLYDPLEPVRPGEKVLSIARVDGELWCATPGVPPRLVLPTGQPR